MDFSTAIFRIAVSFIPLTIGIILHEVAHAYVAYYYGDKTAKNAGRLTLNPIPHFDPLGGICFVITALFSPFVFGWAKPVPINPRNFTRAKNIKTAMAIGAFAGPLTNFILAICFSILLKIFIFLSSVEFLESSVGYFLQNVFLMGVGVNLMLMVINLLPIPSFDGSHIVARFLPYPYDYKYMEFGKYGTIILIILMLTNVLFYILQFFFNLLFPLMIYIIN